jgi:hypothetical protein
MRQKSVKAVWATVMMLIISGVQSQDIPVRDDGFGKPARVKMYHYIDIGAGMGLDYGGLLGFQAGFSPVNHLTLFAAGGYYGIGFGWQAGAKGLLFAKSTENIFRPFLKAMYGTNSVILVDGIDEYNKIYRGFTVGLGCEFRFGKAKRNGFDVDLNVPLRTPDYWQDYNQVKSDPRVDIQQDQIPVAFSVGYHHEF